MNRSERLAALDLLFNDFLAPPPGYPDAPADFTAHDDDSEDAPWITWLSDKPCPFPAMIRTPAAPVPTPEPVPEPEPPPAAKVEAAPEPEPIAAPIVEPPYAPRVEQMFPTLAAARLLVDLFAPEPASAGVLTGSVDVLTEAAHIGDAVANDAAPEKT